MPRSCSVKQKKPYRPWSSKRRSAVFLCLALAVIITAGISITNYLVDDIRDDIIKESDSAMQSMSVYLTAEFNELERTGDVLAGLPWVAAVLESGTPQQITHANEALVHFNKEMDTAVCYILDAEGKVVAASNYRGQDSFVGQVYDFRKYFTQALKGVPSKDFALGVTSSRKGFYVGTPVRNSYNQVIGVAVVKQNADGMEKSLGGYPMCFLINRLGIILLTTSPEYSLKSLWPLDKTLEQELIVSRQFGGGPFTPVLKQEVTNGVEVKFRGAPFLGTREFISQDGWSIVFLIKMQKVRAYKIAGFVTTAALVCILLILYLVIVTWVRTPEKIASLPGRVDNLH